MGTVADQPTQAETATRLSYVRALETQVGTLTAAVQSLEQQVAALTARNQELEAAQAHANGVDRAAVQQLIQQAEEALGAAQAQSHSIQEEAQRQAGEIVGKAQAEANEMISAVSAQIADIEAEAAAATQTREAEALREQIRDLMKLRESIVSSVRGAIDGFGDQLDTLSEPLFAREEEAFAATPVEESSETAAAQEFDVTLLVRPVEGVVEASSIEHGLAEKGVAIRLAAVEGSSAEFAVTGTEPDALRTTAQELFPASRCDWVAADRMEVVLTPTGVS